MGKGKHRKPVRALRRKGGKQNRGHENRKKPAVRNATKSVAAAHDMETYRQGSIETRPDMLYKLIMSRGSVSITEAASRLGADVKHVEDWALILEDHDLIKVHYPAFGNTMLQTCDYRRPRNAGKKRPKKMIAGWLAAAGAAVLFVARDRLQVPTAVSIPGGQMNVPIVAAAFLAALAALAFARRRHHGK